MTLGLVATFFKQSVLLLPVFTATVFIIHAIVTGTILHMLLSIHSKMRRPGLKSTSRYVVLMAELAAMLLRAVMLVVMERVLLLFRHVHGVESLMILSSIHHMLLLLLESILAVDSKVVDHGSARRRSRG